MISEILLVQYFFPSLSHKERIKRDYGAQGALVVPMPTENKWKKVPLVATPDWLGAELYLVPYFFNWFAASRTHR